MNVLSRSPSLKGHPLIPPRVRLSIQPSSSIIQDSLLQFRSLNLGVLFWLSENDGMATHATHMTSISFYILISSSPWSSCETHKS